MYNTIQVQTCVCSVTPATKHSTSWHLGSQNHLGRKGPPEAIWSNFLLKACPVRAGNSSLAQLSTEYLQEWRFHNKPLFTEKKKKEIIPYIIRKTHVPACPCCHPVTVHLSEESGSAISSVFHQAIVETSKITSEPPPPQAKQVQLQQLLLMYQMLQPPDHLGGPALDSL